MEELLFWEKNVSGIVHYEVYVFQNNSWDLLGRYPSEQRATALEYAKSIEKNDRLPTKVLRESYDLNTRTFSEAMVYLSEIQKPKEKPSNVYANSVIPTFSAGKKTKDGANVTENVAVLFLALIVSIIVAGIITAALLHLIVKYEILPTPLSSHYVLGIFFFFFVAVAIPVTVKWVNWKAFLQEEIPPKNEKRHIYPSAENKNISKKHLYEMDSDNEEDGSSSFLSRIMRSFFDAADILMGREPLSERTKKKTKKEPEPEKEEKKASQEQEPEQKSEQKPESETQEQTAVTEEEKAPDSEPEKEEKTSDTVLIPPELENNYLKMTSFLAIILRVLQNKNVLLNTYARFGLELFLAGATEQMCQKDQLTKENNRLILSGLLTLLGRTVTLADIFYYKLDEYVLEPKYLPMIESGADCMRLYSANSSSPELISMIGAAIDNWQNPEQKDTPSSGICTVMFTDMVSSTHVTQMLGDHMAQQLVRLHNTIVRKALHDCSGTEIKHTGDGIMASFTWASNAVDAAIAIQRAVAEHNRQSPTVPLEIRIGLNSGEPIVEDNDLFGHTVQLASRVCGQASANQIYVSSVVKELSAGKNYIFKPLGDFSLKGIDEPQQLYEVVWNAPSLKHEKDDSAAKDKTESPVEEKDLSETLPEF